MEDNKSIIQNKTRMKLILSIICVAFILVFFAKNLMSGFRWPSDYVLTNHVITYVYGFVPRSLIGGICGWIFGNEWYSWKTISAVIMITGIIPIAYFMEQIITCGVKFRETPLFCVLCMFAVSPFSRYYLHEMGYYEQYGYVLVIFLIIIMSRKKGFFYSYILPALLSFIIILISESNIFLVVPIIVAFSFIKILDDSKELSANRIIKKIAILFGLYIPHVIYCIVIWFLKVPADLIKKLQDHDREMVNSFDSYNFCFREDVHWYMSGDRSNADWWGRSLHPIDLWVVTSCLFLIVFTAYFLYKTRNKKLIISYIISSASAGFASYIIVVMGWDMYRYSFCIFMTVLFVSIFTLKSYMGEIRIDWQDMFFIALFFAACLSTFDQRLVLFDDAHYLSTWGDVKMVIRQRIH